MHRCNFCKCDPGVFFVWTSGRNFPINELVKKHDIKDKKYIKSLRKDGYKICMECYNKLKE